jgi:phosphatidylglycerophosphatase A
VPNSLARLFATFFYVGYFPFASGTVASFAGLALCIIFYDNLVLYSLVLAVVLVLGFLSSGIVETMVKQKDPSCVVIDEVAGMMISLFLLPMTVPVIWITFFLFRAFDMFKVYPMNKLEAMGGGKGIMMDDVVAGIYTNIVMHAALYAHHHI